VLGASSDIGIEFIKQVYGQYSCIIAHYNRDAEALQALKNDIGDRIMLLQSDFSDEENTRNFVNTIISENLIPTHIMHLPALKGTVSRFSKIGWNQFENRMCISVRSIVIILNKLLPHMAKRKQGKILFMLTVHTYQTPLKGCADYITEKYALLGLMKALAVEYANKGITVNGISPRAIETKFNSELPEFVIKQYAEGRASGMNLLVREIIPVMQFLLSDEANCITGQNIAMYGDGGSTL
jgi:3-oxoacyl-[acyl-carrier protein] reductase